MAIWPSGLRRWNQAKQNLPYPVRKGVGSNPTVVNVFSTSRTVFEMVVLFLELEFAKREENLH